MAAIGRNSRISLEFGGTDPWPELARAARRWLGESGVPLRDAVLLLPFAALLPVVREAFAAAGGWLPRVETPLTLAATLAPPPAPGAGALCGDRVLDRLHAAALLRQQAWAAARERDDGRGFAHIVGAFVDAAQALRQGASAVAPAEREAFWDLARSRCPASSGPGAVEALLLRAAIEWAAAAQPAATDVLFAHRPAAWIVVRIGGRDALAEAVAGAAACAAAVIDLDACGVGAVVPDRWCCDDREDEAQAAAALVIDALNASRTPVALVALDRELVRRVRALLDRQAVPLIDETGWTLTTTRAAARVMSLLRAAAPGAAADARLEWLKQWPPALAEPRAAEALEALWRRVRGPGDEAAAQALWHGAQTHLRPWAAQRERSLAGWLQLLHETFAADGTLAELQADAAGGQLLQALRLGDANHTWRKAAAELTLDLAGFTTWVDTTLDAAQFLPPPAPGALVVLTPLARAIGRPFAQVIVPGADHAHLGAIDPAPALIGDALVQALGLDGIAARRERQRLCFTQLLRVPALALLRRHRDADEPLAPSPEVEALALARAQAGRALPAERPWQPLRQAVPCTEQPRPQPRAADDLPLKLSASAVEALRQCPYRFFARSVLRLSEPEELDAGIVKRDYGNWLHGVLYRFHRDRQAGQDDALALQRAADDETTDQALDSAELLPYRASFEHFAPAYLHWLAQRDAARWRWSEGEVDRESRPPGLQPQWLAGRLDRLDRAPDGSLQIIDYKTGRADELTRRVADPLEDTQLAFYAALEPAASAAAYLALDDPKAPLVIEHAQVQATAAMLVACLGEEFARLRAGATLPALGEGAVCETCEARGLCRRDHWAGS